MVGKTEQQFLVVSEQTVFNCNIAKKVCMNHGSPIVSSASRMSTEVLDLMKFSVPEHIPTPMFLLLLLPNNDYQPKAARPNLWVPKGTWQMGVLSNYHWLAIIKIE